MVVVLAAYLLLVLLLAGVGVIVWLGIDSAVRGYQLWERRNQDREAGR
jgi:hypothetical protein